MLVKLRRKFIAITMALVSLVLVIVFAVNIFTTYQTSFDSMHASLSQALFRDEGKQAPPQVGGRFEDSREFLPYGDDMRSENDFLESLEPQADSLGKAQLGSFVPVYSVTLNQQGIVSQNNPYVTMDEDLVAQAVEAANTSEAKEGYLHGLDLYYLKTTVEASTRIAFADISAVQDPVVETLQNSILIGLGALAAFFIISVILSRIALRPVEEAWSKQRQFIADASHELKTPLTVILTNNEIVLSHPEDSVEQQKQWLTSSQEEAHRMEGLVNELLLLAQIEEQQDGIAEHPALQNTAIDLSELSQKSLLQYEALAFEKEITLKENISPQVTIKGNPEQIERLIKILLDNAYKYTEEKGTVTLCVKQEKGTGTLSITNTGSTIPPDQIDHIFERFYRTDTARTSNQNAETTSYGLGLSIAKSIAEVHKATLTVASENHLTTFKILFPK